MGIKQGRGWVLKPVPPNANLRHTGMAATRSSRHGGIVWPTSLFCIVLLAAQPVGVALGKKVHISDNLEDVVDDEEDERWRAWGEPKAKPVQPFEPPPDMTGMSEEQIQAEMTKRTVGPSMGFVKLRLGVKRDREVVPGIAKKWTKLLQTGSIQAKIYAVDLNTIMFIVPDGQDSMQVKDFVLSQPEAYEFKLGQQAYRRPGDPPLEEVIQRLEEERANAETGHRQEL